MEQLEQALAYLGRDPLFYMDMLEPLRRGTAELLYAEEDALRERRDTHDERRRPGGGGALLCPAEPVRDAGGP